MTVRAHLKSARVADPVHELPTSWGTKIRTGGLAVILMRAGLKIDKLAFARAGKVVLRLAFFPMLFEALVDAGSYYWSGCFHFPPLAMHCALCHPNCFLFTSAEYG